MNGGVLVMGGLNPEGGWPFRIEFRLQNAHLYKENAKEIDSMFLMFLGLFFGTNPLPHF